MSRDGALAGREGLEDGEREAAARTGGALDLNAGAAAAAGAEALRGGAVGSADAVGAAAVDPEEPASATATIDELRERVRSLAASGRRHLLGITGAPGAGKSTVAEALVQDGVSVLVGMDGYHLGDHLLVERGMRVRKGAPDTFDVEGFVALLERIRAQRPGDREVFAPLFDRGIENAIGSAVPVDASVPVVIVEGNYLLHDDGGWESVRDVLDEVWFLDPGESTRMERLIARHERYGRDAEAARARATGSDERNAALVRATRLRADLIVTVRSSLGAPQARS